MTPQEKYDKQNTRFIGLKLNRKSDKDILDALEGKALQTEIKRLLRKALESEKEEKEWKMRYVVFGIPHFSIVVVLLIFGIFST